MKILHKKFVMFYFINFFIFYFFFVINIFELKIIDRSGHIEKVDLYANVYIRLSGNLHKFKLAYVDCLKSKYYKPKIFYKFRKYISKLISKKVQLDFLHHYDYHRQKLETQIIVYDPSKISLNLILLAKDFCVLKKYIKFNSISDKTMFLKSAKKKSESKLY
jgi:hypothetical protein